MFSPFQPEIPKPTPVPSSTASPSTTARPEVRMNSTSSPASFSEIPAALARRVRARSAISGVVARSAARRGTVIAAPLKPCTGLIAMIVVAWKPCIRNCEMLPKPKADWKPIFNKPLDGSPRFNCLPVLSKTNSAMAWPWRSMNRDASSFMFRRRSVMSRSSDIRRENSSVPLISALRNKVS